MSRSTKRGNINFINYTPPTTTGYIYKITSDEGKIYIGSTNNYIARFESHKKDLDGSPLHQAIQHKGADKFKFEMIEEVPYIDIEQLHILESVYMDKFNSISGGYNTKHSVSLFDLY